VHVTSLISNVILVSNKMTVGPQVNIFENMEKYWSNARNSFLSTG